MRAILDRLETSDQGTFGRLVFGDFALFTGELPWRGNERNVSCIPFGIYSCRWTYSPRFHCFMYMVDGVPDRSGIRFHSANLMGDKALGYYSQLNGCIALGERLGKIDKQKAVIFSRPALRKFESFFSGQSFQLEVKNV